MVLNGEVQYEDSMGGHHVVRNLSLVSSPFTTRSYGCLGGALKDRLLS
jgi:hypothetical protein